MTKYLIAVGFVIVISGMLSAILFNSEPPQPIKEINPSHYNSEVVIGASVYRRIRQDILNHKILFIGSSPFLKNYHSIWSGFFTKAQLDHFKYDLVIEQKGLRPLQLDTTTITLDFLTQQKELVKEIKDQLKLGNRIIIHGVSFDSTHLSENSQVVQLENLLGLPILSITQQVFSADKKKTSSIQPPCREDENTASSLLGCAGLKMTKNYSRYKLDPKRLAGALQKHGPSDHILFIHEPY